MNININGKSALIFGVGALTGVAVGTAAAIFTKRTIKKEREEFKKDREEFVKKLKEEIIDETTSKLKLEIITDIKNEVGTEEILEQVTKGAKADIVNDILLNANNKIVNFEDYVNSKLKKYEDQIDEYEEKLDDFEENILDFDKRIGRLANGAVKTVISAFNKKGDDEDED